MDENNMPEWEASVMSDYRRIDLMRSEIARLSAEREKDAAAMRAVVEVLGVMCTELKYGADFSASHIARHAGGAAIALLRERIES